MTISTTTNSVQYTGNGVTTAFAVPFVFYDASDLIVTYTVIATGVDTVKTITTDYTVSGGDGSTGTVTALSAPASTIRITIERSIPYTQESDLLEGAAVLAETWEKVADRNVVLSQQLLASSNRALKFPATLSGSFTGLLPAPEDGKILVWDGATGQIANADIADLSTTVDTVFTGLASGDFLTYDGTNWVNTDVAEVSAALDLGALATLDTTSAAQGSIIYRGASGWQILASGTNGHFLKTQGAGANPVWAATSGGPTLPLAISDGGTGTTTEALARAALGTNDAANITTGTIATARLGSGTPDSTTFLRGDQTYAVPTPPTTNGAVGTYAMLWSVGASVTRGTTYSGNNFANMTSTSVWASEGVAVSGTWRAMNAGTGGTGFAFLAVRIS